jgi:hypothetical protein
MTSGLSGEHADSANEDNIKIIRILRNEFII